MAPSNQNQPIIIKVDFKSKELSYPLRWLWIRLTATKIRLLVSTLIIVAGVMLVGDYLAVGIIAITAGVSLLTIEFIIVGVILPQAPKRRSDSGPTLYIISENGVEIRTESFALKSQWSRYPRSFENRSFYMLQIAGNVLMPHFVVLPKRGLQSDSDETLFRQMLMQHTEARLMSRPSLEATGGQRHHEL